MDDPIKQIRIEGQLAYVPLTRGLESVIDVADLPLLNGWRWVATTNGKYAVGFTRKRADWAGPSQLGMHRLIMSAPKGLQVDHINGDGLDNRRANLRLATNAQNQCNRGMAKHNTSGFKGVTAYGKTGRWLARIWVAGKMVSLGVFDKPEDAGLAYRIAAERLHGEFAPKPERLAKT